MKDGSLKITLITRELSPQQMAELMLNLNKEVISIDIPEDAGEKKSVSQRLRDCLYVLWEQKYKDKYEGFEMFYRTKMEQIIESVKSKLEPK